MVKLTGMNNREFVLNAEHIEKIDAMPETIITLVNGNKYIVLETIDEVIELVINYKKKIFNFGK